MFRLFAFSHFGIIEPHQVVIGMGEVVHSFVKMQCLLLTGIGHQVSHMNDIGSLLLDFLVEFSTHVNNCDYTCYASE